MSLLLVHRKSKPCSFCTSDTMHYILLQPNGNGMRSVNGVVQKNASWSLVIFMEEASPNLTLSIFGNMDTFSIYLCFLIFYVSNLNDFFFWKLYFIPFQISLLDLLFIYLLVLVWLVCSSLSTILFLADMHY